jgi:predicted enzyme related to lactoylglutathione lyase
MNSPSFFEIQATNPKKLVDFYSNVFGWKFTEQKGLPIEYYAIETDGIRGGLLQRPVPITPMSGTNAFTCSMEVTDFDMTAEKIMKEGGQVAMDKFAVPGKCWQGYFLDTDGNVFGIFEVDAKAK